MYYISIGVRIMEFIEEKKVEMVDFEIEMSEEERKNLSKLGLEWIKNDENALINYAVNHILREIVEKKQVQEFLAKKAKLTGDKNDKS